MSINVALLVHASALWKPTTWMNNIPGFLLFFLFVLFFWSAMRTCWRLLMAASCGAIFHSPDREEQVLFKVHYKARNGPEWEWERLHLQMRGTVHWGNKNYWPSSFQFPTLVLLVHRNPERNQRRIFYSQKGRRGWLNILQQNTVSFTFICKFSVHLLCFIFSWTPARDLCMIEQEQNFLILVAA